MSKLIKVGVIGLGVGERHLAAYKDIPDCEVVAICDFDRAKLDQVGERQGVMERHTEWRRITEHPDIDVISICSYDNFHAEQAVSAFRNGKHVMVEKPVSLHMKDAEAVLRAMKDSGKKISSNLILRQSPRFRVLKTMIAEGEFGEIFYLEADYIHEILWKIVTGWRGKMDFYCVTYGGGIHLIDLMCWLMDQKVEEVSGMGNKILTRDSDFSFPDTIVNLLRFSGGALAKTLTTFGSQRSQIHALELYGTKRTFINDIPDGKLFGGPNPEDEEKFTVPYPAIKKGDLLPDFIAAIREDREPLITAQDVFRAMCICFAAWESVRQNCTINVSYLI